MNTMELRRADQSYALSSLQQRILPVALKTPLIGKLKATLKGPITQDTARRAAAALLNHHPVLRTTLLHSEPPRQSVHHAAPISIDWIGPEQEHKSPGFDLSRLPLTHISIRDEGPDRFSLEWSIHPLLADDTSLKLMLRDFLHLLAGGAPAPAPTFHEQLNWISLLDHSADEDFWCGYFAGFTTELAPAKGDGTGLGTLTSQLQPDLLARLAKKAKATSTSLETLLLSAFAEAVGQLKDTRDVVFGVTLSGRTSPVMNVENCVGPLEPLVPLRVELDNPDLLLDLAESMNTLRSLAHTPDALMLKWSELPTTGHLFETSFALRAQPAEQTTGPFIVSDLEVVIPNGAPLQVDVDARTGALTAIFDRSLFNSPQISAFLAAFELAARSAGETVSAAISIAGPEAQSASLDVLERFLAMAEKTPKAIAVSDADSTLNFAGLKSCAESVAAYLVSAGVMPGDRVALVQPRSVEMIVGILGTLMAGAAFIPIDRDTSPKRIQQILAASDPMAVLGTDEPGMTDIAGIPEAPLEQVVPSIPIMPAYLSYSANPFATRPGVEVSRGALAASQTARDTFYPEAPSAFLMTSPFASDHALAAIFWCLTSGANLVLSEKAQPRDLPQLAAQIAQQSISHIQLTPTQYDAFLRALPFDLRSLKQVILRGETCPRVLPYLHAQTLPDCWLANEYGPTEAAIWTAAELNGPREAAPMTLGKPIQGMQIFLIGPKGTPAQSGEIAIAGACLASGYFNDAAATDQAFSELELGDGTVTRVFRTGDFGELSADGRIIFLGRQDRQIKLRGQRIALSDLEAHIAELEGIRDVALNAVASSDDPTRHTRLIAYIASDKSSDQLLAQLKQSLGTETAPDEVIAFRELPRLPSGKLDLDTATPAPPPEQKTPAAADPIPKAPPANKPVRTLATSNIFLLNLTERPSQILAERLGPKRKLHAIDIALAKNSNPIASIEDAATRLLPRIRDRQAHGPYVIGGCKIGAVLAHELARQLAAAGEPVHQLLLINPPEDPDLFATAYNRDHTFTGSRSDKAVYTAPSGFGLHTLLGTKSRSNKGILPLLKVAKYYTLREPAAPPIILRRKMRAHTTLWAKAEEPHELREVQCGINGFETDEDVLREWTSMLVEILT